MTAYSFLTIIKCLSATAIIAVVLCGCTSATDDVTIDYTLSARVELDTGAIALPFTAKFPTSIGTSTAFAADKENIKSIMPISSIIVFKYLTCDSADTNTTPFDVTVLAVRNSDTLPLLSFGTAKKQTIAGMKLNGIRFRLTAEPFVNFFDNLRDSPEFELRVIIAREDGKQFEIRRIGFTIVSTFRVNSRVM